MSTLTYRGQLVVVTCWCGIPHAIPSELHNAQMNDPQQAAYCPLGHTYVSSKPRVQEVEEQLLAERREVARQKALRDQAEADARYQQHRANGYKGAAAKATKRAAKGVCPAPGCQRSFVNVAKHVATCHPELTNTEEKA